MPETPSHQINLLDFLAFLIRWRRFLITAMLGVGIGVGVITLFMKPVYRSMAVVHSTEQSSSGFGSFLAAKWSMLSSLGGGGQLFGESSSDLDLQILHSRWMMDTLITTFDLRKVYGLQDAPQEQLVEAAKGHTRSEVDQRSTSVLIYAEDTDPKRSQEMTQFLVDQLDRRNQELHASSAGSERDFVGGRLEEASSKLASLEDSLTRFQMSSGVFNADAQLKATLDAASQLGAQRLALQTELEMNSQVYAGRNPEGTYLRLRMASLDSTLQSLAEQKAGSKSSDVMVHLKDMPRDALAYMRLRRDIEIQQLLVEFLVQQHEQAKIEQRRDTPTIMRVDSPTVPTRRVWPQRSLMVAIGMAGALVFGITFALIYEWICAAMRDPNDPQYQRIARIRAAWKGKEI